MTSLRHFRRLTPEQYASKVDARFWSKVNKTETCWLWTARVTTNGYGACVLTEYQNDASREGAKRREVRAHRYSWEKANGPIPDGIDIDHICHNRLCVRPEHLRPTTRKQNLENRSGVSRNNTSGARGVRWAATKNRWRATVGHNGKEVHVGYFISVAEAEAAVVAKRLELHTHNDEDRQAS